MTASAVSTAARRRPLQLLWGVCADVLVFILTIAVTIPVIALILVTRRTWAVEVFGPLWCRGALAICGVKVEVHGLEKLDPKRSYVIISNHQSNFDIWATAGSLPLNLRFVAKKELTRIPFFGQALKLSDHVVIDRKNPDEAIARINARVAVQGAAPFCLLFYAEGTRSPDGKVHAFKKGGVTLAIRTGLPIVPLSISGTWKLLPKSTYLIRPGGRVKIVLDDPIDTTTYSLEQRDALNERVRDVVIKNFVEDF